MIIKKSHKIVLTFLAIVKVAVFLTLLMSSCNRYVHSANSNVVIYRHK